MFGAAYAIYRDVAWFFAGGIFGGEPEYLLLFADYMKIACLTLIQEKRNKLLKINSLEYLVNFTILNLNENSMSDLTPIYKLTKLKEISLCRNKIESIYPLYLL
jgi:hypothetical protein